ncbi:hypothetical protein BH11BAC2_BH11BAC2_13170 [soil metagenome]
MNNRLLFLLTIFLIFGKSLQAQTSEPSSDQKFHFGFKIAPTLAWMHPLSKSVEKDGAKLGFSYGAVLEFKIQENYAFCTGLQSSYRGGAVILKKDGFSEKATFRLQYVEVPITLKMKTNSFDKIKYFGQFGFIPGVNIRAKADTDAEDDVDVKDDINAFMLSLLIAAGVEYTISGSTVAVASIEFNNGFLDTFQSKDYKAGSNFLALNIGILF